MVVIKIDGGIYMKDRVEVLKSYLQRLGKGESLESVRADFVKEFAEVDATEIMKAEQQMMKEGTPITEVQKLCDVHAALFHGMTQEEKKKNEEKRTERAEKTKRLVALKGHPLWTLTQENAKLLELIKAARKGIEEKGKVGDAEFSAIRELAIHYAKKGDLLYPVLKEKYGITGPADIMWTVDDEIRDELVALGKSNERDSAWMERFSKVLIRAEEMIFKEENILFPNCAANFTKEEWMGIYQDAKDYAVCFGVEPVTWKQAEGVEQRQEEKYTNGEIYMAGGHMTVEQLVAMLNTIPIEITLVDKEDNNCFFNEGPKVFKRPTMAIGRPVFSCHPPKVEQQVRRIIGEFKAGTLDEVPIWMEKGGRCMYVKYMAVRNYKGEYLGTLELVQDMEFAKEYFTKNSKVSKEV